MTSRLHTNAPTARVRRVKLLFIGDIVGKPGRHAVRGLGERRGWQRYQPRESDGDF